MSDRSIDLAAARAFLLTHARVLEVRLAEVYVDEAPPSPALVAALEAYRNPDGGFGNGLESDVRAPTSQPLGAEIAFEILDDLVWLPSCDGRFRELVKRSVSDTLSWLHAASASTNGGLPLVFPSIAAYPRAAHWGNGEYLPSVLPTASLAARAYDLGITHPWIDAAFAFSRTELAAADAITDAHTVLSALRFLEAVPDRSWADRIYQDLGSRIGSLEYMHPMPGEGYGLTPLRFAPAPDSPRRRFFTDEAIEAHLGALVAAQEPDGGWPVSWEPPGPAAVLAWRGVETLRALRVLRAYGRLPAAA